MLVWLQALSLNAQDSICATPPLPMAFEKWLAQAQQHAAYKTSETLLTLPVIVHICHHGEAVGTGTNLSAARIYSQIQVLNEDFRRQFGTRGYNSDPVGADAQISFCPVLLAPNGDSLAEIGIHRVNVDSLISIAPPYSPALIRQQILPKTYWEPTRYLNIWVTEIEQYLGFAQFPDSSTLSGVPPSSNGDSATDGVVINYKNFGITGVATAKYNYGRTATHEMGHFLGLRHIWGDGGCDADDFCDDTPLAGKANTQCDSANHSCGFRSMDNNYMDYTPDRCQNIFTQCQTQRMRTVLQLAPRRRSLLNASPCGTLPLPPTATNPTVTLFPNPATTQISLYAAHLAGDIAHILLYNVLGQRLLKNSLALQNGKAETALSCDSLADGVYYVEVIAGDFRYIGRVVVAKL